MTSRVCVGERTYGLLLAALMALACGPAAPPAAKPSTEPPPTELRPPTVLVIGWDGADWSLLDPMMANGELPELARLVARGRTAVIDVPEPLLSPIIWTTLATGVEPPLHGVLGFEEFAPETGERIPITARSRTYPALWSTASAKGHTVGVVGWWATWPAERVRGILVSERFLPTVLARPPAGAGLVHPESQLPAFVTIRDEEIARAASAAPRVFGYEPARARALAGGATVVDGLERTLAQTHIVARSARRIVERAGPELLAVYFEGTDEVGHLAGIYHPPRLACAADADYQVFSNAVRGYYREADRLLGDVLALADVAKTSVILVSDHGFRWGADRPCYQGAAAGTAAYWHTSTGVLVAAGPAIRGGARGHATPLVLAPLVSRLLGLPRSSAMTAAIPPDWLDASRLPAEPPLEDLAATVPVTLAEAAGDAATDRAALERLRSLGYLSGASSGRGPAGDRPARTEESWSNLGVHYRAKGRLDEAEAAFRQALALAPADASTHHNLSFLLLDRGRLDDSDAELVASIRAGNPRAAALLRSRVEAYDGARASRIPRLIAAILVAGRADLPQDVGRGLYEAKNCGLAGRVLEATLAAKVENPELLNLAAVVRLCLGDPAGARQRFERSLALDPNQEIPRQVLGELSR